MKKSYRKVIVREVTHTLSRFLAIFGIVALGVGFLAGTSRHDAGYAGVGRSLL